MINVLGTKNIFPTAGGQSVGEMSTGYASNVPESIGMSDQSGGGSGHVEQAIAIGNTMSPLVGLGVFAGLSLGLILIAKRAGDAGEFSNLKGSMYNALFISLVAVTGIPAWKYVFTKLKVPGVSTWVLSA